MKEAKALGALTASLLARKGEARPVMRAADEQLPGWTEDGAVTRPRLALGSTFPAEKPAVVRQQLELGDRIAAGDLGARKLRSRAKGLGEGRKAAFTLRLDADRHHKLRLACAISGRSAQTIVADALDAYLADLPSAPKQD